MGVITWIASYPKSGNTWLRAFLAAYLHDSEVDINRLGFIPVASARDLIEREIGYGSSHLTAEEVDRLRPEIYRALARRAEGTCYLKAHDAFGSGPNGEPLFPPDVTLSAVYVVRHPLDVCVSYSYHRGWADHRWSVQFMGDPTACLAAEPGRWHDQVRQRLGTWSEHVISWTERAPFPVTVVRYEDLVAQPCSAFSSVLAALGLVADTGRLERAIGRCCFDRLKQQEAARGFRERKVECREFFRSGAVGGWQQELTAEDARLLISAHRAVMTRFGYLSETDRA